MRGGLFRIDSFDLILFDSMDIEGVTSEEKVWKRDGSKDMERKTWEEMGLKKETKNKEMAK